jgi:hypothetical protein
MSIQFSEPTDGNVMALRNLSALQLTIALVNHSIIGNASP